jgi:hypothetical protein
VAAHWTATHPHTHPPKHTQARTHSPVEAVALVVLAQLKAQGDILALGLGGVGPLEVRVLVVVHHGRGRPLQVVPKNGDLRGHGSFATATAGTHTHTDVVGTRGGHATVMTDTTTTTMSSMTTTTMTPTTDTTTDDDYEDGVERILRPTPARKNKAPRAHESANNHVAS